MTIGRDNSALLEALAALQLKEQEANEVLSHFTYDDVTRIVTTDRAIETTLNSLYLGKQHKMSSGSENVYFTNLNSNINFFPMWGGLKDQSLTVNQGPSGVIAPSGRVYSDFFSLPLGGQPDPLNSVGYSGENYFGVNISGLGITTVAAESVAPDIRLEYRITINGRQVYMQELPRAAARSSAGTSINPGDVIEWFFDHPVDVHAGTTLIAEIIKVGPDDVDLGVFQVRRGDTPDPNTGLYRYQATVHNRLYTDKDLELISPYLKYQAMDFCIDPTGASILMRDLSLPTGEQMLIPHNINTVEAVATGTTIQIKVKDGAKVLVDSLPVSGASINGSMVNSVLNNAVTELNSLFTNGVSFASQGNPVQSFVLSGNNLVLGLEDSTSYSVDITTLGVDTNNFVSSGSLSGTDLTLTMADATTVVIDASSLAVDEDTTINFGTLANNLLTLTASDSSTVTIDVSSLAVDENLHVVSGELDGLNIDLTMSDDSVVTVAVGSLAIDNNTTITGGTVVGTDIQLSLSDSSIIIIDATTLATGGGNEVVSGSVVGTDLVLTMSDATTVTIDATNMINGSTGLAIGGGWFISYGSSANQAVGHPKTNVAAGVGGNAPFYFGTALTQGSEMRYTHVLNNKHCVFGVWAGTEAAAGTYNSRVHSYNWSTAFRWNGQAFVDFNTNMDLITANNTLSAYTPVQGSAMVVRFGNDGHVSLINIVSGAEVLVMKTTVPLSVDEFHLQMGSDQDQFFPNAQVVDIESLWEVVHDYSNVEAGIINGILDHTVIKSGISIEMGEKIMFMLDFAGNGDNFGTGYSNAATGISTAENELVNHFKYQTNEALVFTLSGTNDWTMSTGADGYFYAASLDQYRNGGGSGTIQGLFSLRFNNDGKLTIYDEDAGHKVATAKSDPPVGSSVHLYMGVQGGRTYNKIPVISKQSLSASNQPLLTFAPDVSNHTFNVSEGEAFTLQVSLDAGSDIVNQYGEVDAPSWAVLNQTTGEFIGTAPAFTGSSDSYVVNCKAANAIGGITNFTVTVNVSEVAYTNSKSLSFNGTSTWLQANPSTMTAFSRATNGDGNAWTIAMWMKPSTSTSTNTLFVFGEPSGATSGTVTVQQHGGSNILVTYGSYTDKIIVLATGCLTVGAWNHLVVTFDGGTTGAVAADLADYYSRFSIAVDGAVVSQIGTHANNGYDGSIDGTNTSDQVLRIGRDSNIHNNYLDGVINQVGIWDTDQSANIATIYNGGATQALSDLAAPPVHYYEIETSVTSIPDLIGSTGLTGYNFTVSDLVTDTP